MDGATQKLKADRDQEEKDMQALGLLQRLETQEVSKNRINTKKFDTLKKIGSVIGKDKLIGVQKVVNRLSDLVNYELLPILHETEEFDADF